MDKKIGLYAFLGMLIGAIFGMGLGAANGNAAIGIGSGALTGMFLGWFIAAVILDKESNKKEKR